MKKTILYGIVLVAVAAMVFFIARGYSSTEKESSAFVQEAIDTISESWSVDDFKAISDPGLVKAMNGKPGDGLEILFGYYRALGKLHGSADCELMNSGMLVKGQEDYDVATYHCNADYDAGPAKIEITVRKGKSKTVWEIYYLKIQSDAFTGSGETDGN